MVVKSVGRAQESRQQSISRLLAVMLLGALGRAGYTERNMAYSDDAPPTDKALIKKAARSPKATTRELSRAEPVAESKLLPYLPGQSMSDEALRLVLSDGELEEQIQIVSHLLAYAPWDDIWDFVERDQVRALFDRLELPPSLRRAWARNLDIDLAALAADSSS